MTANHIDQMHAWWQEANDGIPKAGDTIIADERHKGRGFYVYQATKDHPHGYDNIRVLHRAPAPKPAWHDAVAVIATADVENGDAFTCIWAPDGQSGYWESCEGFYVKAEALRDVTPLIEAKVTDEMVEAAQQEAKRHTGLILERLLVSRMIAAALGLEAA